MGLLNDLDNNSRLSDSSTTTQYYLITHIDETKNKVKSIHNIELENNKFMIEKIRFFVSKNLVFFSGFINKHKLICKKNLTYGEIEREYGNDVSLIIKDFFEVFKDNIENKIEYQKILSDKGNLLFFEVLTRIQAKKGSILTFNLGDYLSIHLDLNNTFDIYLNVLNLVFIDFSKRGLPESKISINVEISDIMDDRFIKAFKGMQKKYNINITKENNPLVIEILENQHLGEDKESRLKFRNRIKELKGLGFKIAMDDVISEQLPTDKTLENIDNLALGDYRNLVDYVKVDGKFIHNIFKVYKTCPRYLNIDSLKKDFEKIQSKGIGLVFEWIENQELVDFITNTLNIKNPNFQGFYFK